MNRENLPERLDQEIEQLGVCTNVSADGGAETRQLLDIVAALRCMPDPQFRQHLKLELLDHAENGELSRDIEAFGSDPAPDHVTAMLTTAHPAIPGCDAPAEISVPSFLSLFAQRELITLPADARSLLFSFASHAALVVLIVSGVWLGRRAVVKPGPLSSELTYLPLPAGAIAPHGGGNGGDHSKVPASQGTPPKFSDEQPTPPAIVVRNPAPKLQAESTVLGPPQLKLPETKQLGELLSTNIAMPSNGIGSEGGIGSNRGTGDGTGSGPGAGSGVGGGCCSGTYIPGKDVSPPRALFDPEPDYSEEARKVRLQGSVVLSLVVDTSGHPRNVHVARSLGMGLDEKAIEAVQKWKFAPGMKNGYPVATRVEVEVNFHLY